MIEVRLDGRQISDKKQLHDQLSMELGFPAWYGSNLDALYDCLTDLGPFRMVLSHREAMAETDFGRRLWAVLRDAAAENPYLELEEQ